MQIHWFAPQPFVPLQQDLDDFHMLEWRSEGIVHMTPLITLVAEKGVGSTEVEVLVVHMTVKHEEPWLFQQATAGDGTLYHDAHLAESACRWGGDSGGGLPPPSAGGLGALFPTCPPPPPDCCTKMSNNSASRTLSDRLSILYGGPHTQHVAAVVGATGVLGRDTQARE